MTDDFEKTMDAQVDKVIEAAINADMFFRGFHEGSCKDGEFRDKLLLTLTPDDPEPPYSTVDMIVTYPEGKWYVDNAGQRVPYEQTGFADMYPVPFEARPAVYNSWAGNIGAPFADWKTLPDPAGFSERVTTLRDVAFSLNAGGAYTDGEGDETQIEGGNLVLNDYVSYIDDELAQYNSDMIDTFDANYASRVRPTLSGQHVAACILGTLMTGEQELMRRAREDVLKVAKQAEKAFNDLCTARETNWKDVFTAVGVVTAAAGLFLSAGTAATAVAAVGTVTGIIDKFTPAPEKKPEPALAGSTPDEVLESLNTCLDDLRDVVKDQETSFHWCGFRASGYVRNNEQYFDIAKPKDFLEDDDGEYFKDGENINILMPHLRKIAARFELVAGIQSKAARDLDSTTGSTPWMRWETIGFTSEGHYNAYEDLYTELSEVVAGSAKEMSSVAERLVEVSYDFQATEDQIEQTLKKQTKDVKDAQPDYD